MAFPVEKPDLVFRRFRMTWEKASQRVFVVADNRSVCWVLADLLQALERYAHENRVLLFVPGEYRPFRGNTDKLELLRKLVVVKSCTGIPDKELFALYEQLFGSVALLVGPAAFSEAPPETRDALGVGALRAARIVWRHARLLSFAAFAVLPDSKEFSRLFPELADACVKVPGRFL